MLDSGGWYRQASHLHIEKNYFIINCFSFILLPSCHYGFPIFTRLIRNIDRASRQDDTVLGFRFRVVTGHGKRVALRGSRATDQHSRFTCKELEIQKGTVLGRAASSQQREPWRPGLLTGGSDGSSQRLTSQCDTDHLTTAGTLLATCS